LPVIYNKFTKKLIKDKDYTELICTPNTHYQVHTRTSTSALTSTYFRVPYILSVSRSLRQDLLCTEKTILLKNLKF